ncbi:hypothetical protein HDU76_008487 [Blyttiomyces sp. JEL0837]|nr:hypothetical protein HDU76_008487 [Blyttiomyces sp. JEL0837]
MTDSSRDRRKKSHGGSSSSAKSEKHITCKQFERTGKCDYGTDCKYSHEGAQPAGPRDRGNRDSPSPPSSSLPNSEPINPTALRHKKFLEKVIVFDGVKMLSTVSEIERFLQYIVEIPERMDFLTKLVTTDHGLKALSHSLSILNENPRNDVFIDQRNAPFLNGYAVPFIRYMFTDNDLMRATRREVLTKLVDCMHDSLNFFDALMSATLNKFITDEESVAWFVLQLAAFTSTCSDKVRKNNKVISWVNSLRFSDNPKLKEQARRITTVMGVDGGAGGAGVNVPSGGGISLGAPIAGGGSKRANEIEEYIQANVVDAPMDFPGGRHSNDFEDFRKIKILPIADEVVCTEEPYLVRPMDLGGGATTTVAGASYDLDHELEKDGTLEARFLDMHFRLLREDMIGPLREELRLLTKASSNSGTSTGSNKKKNDHFDAKALRRLQKRTVQIVSWPTIELHNRFNDYINSYLEVAFADPKDCPPPGQDDDSDSDDGKGGSTSRNNKPSKKPRSKATTKRRTYWDESRFLAHGSLVCILQNGIEPLFFATVTERELDKLQKYPSRIGLAVDADNMQFLLKSVHVLEGRPLSMVEVTASMFAYAPILKGLQERDSVPFDDILLKAYRGPRGGVWAIDEFDDATRPRHFRQIERVWRMLEGSKPDDDLQKLLMLHKAGKPVKLDPTQKEAIVTALSNRIGLIQGPPGTGKSFCGALIAKIIYDNTRETILVTCYTNHALDSFLLDLVKIGVPKDAIVRIGGGNVDPALADIALNKLRGTVLFTREENNTYNNLKRKLIELGEAVEKKRQVYQAAVARMSQNLSWNEVKAFLEDEERQFYKAFVWDDDDSAAFDGMTRVGRYGKAVKSGDLYVIWTRGDPGPNEIRGRSMADRRVWDMDVESRRGKMMEWREEIIGTLADDLLDTLKEYNMAAIVKDAIEKKKRVSVLQSKRIIAATTTGAAKNWELIESVQAGVALMEESGEILESHVLTR